MGHSSARFTSLCVAVGAPVTRHSNGEFALSQLRFWEHAIRNEIDFERPTDYVHSNQAKPMRAMRLDSVPAAGEVGIA
jgi:REP element-mobilizing transposase RayT